MRLCAELTIWDEDPVYLEQIWFETRIILLWWKLTFRVSKECLGSTKARFFLGTSKRFLKVSPQETVKDNDDGTLRVELKHNWRLKLRGTTTATTSG